MSYDKVDVGAMVTECPGALKVALIGQAFQSHCKTAEKAAEQYFRGLDKAAAMGQFMRTEWVPHTAMHYAVIRYLARRFFSKTPPTSAAA